MKETAMQKIRIILVLMATVCLLTACGFHFRASADLPPQLKTVYLESTDPHSDLLPLLRENLKTLGVNIANSPQDSPVTLTIESENFTQGSSKIGTAQQVNTVNLIYTVVYSLKDSAQKSITPPITLSSSTTYLQSANQILGDTAAIPALEQQLRRDVTEEILWHLSSNNTRTALVQHQQTD